MNVSLFRTVNVVSVIRKVVPQRPTFDTAAQSNAAPVGADLGITCLLVPSTC